MPKLDTLIRPGQSIQIESLKYASLAAERGSWCLKELAKMEATPEYDFERRAAHARTCAVMAVQWAKLALACVGAKY